MKKQINFEELQRFDKIDANDLQENIYNQLEEVFLGMFKSNTYGIANQSTRTDAAKRNAMHGCLRVVPTVSILQNTNQLAITKPFTVVERNSGDVITFTQEDIDLGYGVIELAEVQSFVDDNESAFTAAAGVDDTYSALCIWAYPLNDTDVESRQFWDPIAGSATGQDTTVRNNTRLQLFADLYERRVNIKNADDNYPTLIGLWYLGRTPDNVVDGGVVQPVYNWPTSAGWTCNSVWTWIFPDQLNPTADGPNLTDATTNNADKLPNTITDSGTIRYSGDGTNDKHDIRLAFKIIQRLIDRIQCNGTDDPTTTDLGNRATSVAIVDKYGNVSSDLKSVDTSLHAEHPPYSLRGLKRLHDIEVQNKTLTSSIFINFENYTTDTAAFQDGVARTVRRQQFTTSGDFQTYPLFDYYGVFTQSCGVADPPSSATQMDLQNATANSSTGVVEDINGNPVTNVTGKANMFRSFIFAIPSAYYGWNITSINVTPVYRHPTDNLASSIWLAGPYPPQTNGQLLTPFAAVFCDNDDTMKNWSNTWSTSHTKDQLTNVTTITYTNAGGTKASSTGVRFVLGPDNWLSNNFGEELAGLCVSVSIKNNEVAN